MNRYRDSKGQSIAEFLVALAFLVPALLMIPTLANMLSVQTAAHKASRYVAWERTAYSTADLKTANELEEEVEQRFFVGEDQGFGSVPSEIWERWRDFKTKVSMVDIGDEGQPGVAMNLDGSRSATAGNSNASAWLAGRGGLDDPNNAIELDTLQVAQLSIPISSELSILQTSTPVNAWHQDPDAVSNIETPQDPISGQSRFYVASSSALVADGWTSIHDNMFNDRVSSVNTVSRPFMNFWENTMGLSGLLTTVGFDEIPRILFTNPDGRSASLDMVDPEQSLNLPADSLSPFTP